jgi:pimeloyl-ACP methyl ester carboxylesterase
MEKSLFLHWGPGGNAQAELKQFNARFPSSFVWWNQPAPSPASLHPYQDILDAAFIELNRIHQETQTAVRLVAHSFGVQLALDLVQKAPEKISRLVLIGALSSVIQGHVKLGYRLARHYRDETIKSTTLEFEKEPGFATFSNLIQAVTRYPDFLIHYWGYNQHSLKARDAFLQFAEGTPIMDFDTYLLVMKNLFDSKILDRPVPSLNLPVEIHLGNQDPYFDIKDEMEEWQKKIPQAKIIAHTAGHFVHLESSIEW